MATQIDRCTAQTLTTKLDTNAISLKEAKQFVARLGVDIVGRTKEQFIRNLNRAAPPSWHVSLETAIDLATKAADDYTLPQTVYRNADTCGWANTNFLAPVLDRSELFVTILPARYFQ